MEFADIQPSLGPLQPPLISVPDRSRVPLPYCLLTSGGDDHFSASNSKAGLLSDAKQTVSRIVTVSVCLRGMTSFYFFSGPDARSSPRLIFHTQLCASSRNNA